MQQLLLTCICIHSDGLHQHLLACERVRSDADVPAAGLFEWSMKHSDGTQATQQPSPEELAW
jgi:hypothetical protein